jgi:hypothetical protein
MDVSLSNQESPLAFVKPARWSACPWGKTRLVRMLVTWLLLLGSMRSAFAQSEFYGGLQAGVSTLSGDAASTLSAGAADFSSYNPQNGIALSAIFGRDVSEYVSLQADYIYSRNRLALASGAFSNGTLSGYQEVRGSSQQSVIGDVLVCFRQRQSRLRPYLSVGTGVVHFSSFQQRVDLVAGSPSLPPQRFSSNLIALHVPVGMDVKLRGGWMFRYSFSETLSFRSYQAILSPAFTFFSIGRKDSPANRSAGVQGTRPAHVHGRPGKY